MFSDLWIPEIGSNLEFTGQNGSQVVSTSLHLGSWGCESHLLGSAWIFGPTRQDCGHDHPGVHDHPGDQEGSSSDMAIFRRLRRREGDHTWGGVFMDQKEYPGVMGLSAATGSHGKIQFEVESATVRCRSCWFGRWNVAGRCSIANRPSCSRWVGKRGRSLPP